MSWLCAAIGAALTNDSSWLAYMRVWLDEETHRGPAWSGRPGTAGSRDRIGQQPAEAFVAGADSFSTPLTVVRSCRCPPSTGRARDGPSSDRKIGIHITSVPLVKLIVLVPAELQLLLKVELPLKVIV